MASNRAKRRITDDDIDVNRPVLPKHGPSSRHANRSGNSQLAPHFEDNTKKKFPWTQSGKVREEGRKLSSSSRKPSQGILQVKTPHKIPWTQSGKVREEDRKLSSSSRKPSEGALQVKTSHKIPWTQSRKVREEDRKLSSSSRKQSEGMLEAKTSHTIPHPSKRSGSPLEGFSTEKSKIPPSLPKSPFARMPDSSSECDEPELIEGTTQTFRDDAVSNKDQQCKKAESSSLLPATIPGAFPVGPVSSQRNPMSQRQKIRPKIFIDGSDRESDTISTPEDRSNQVHFNKEERPTNLVEHVDGPHLSHQNYRSTLPKKASFEKDIPSTDLPLAAEVVPNERDVEAQLEERLRKQIRDEAVEAAVVDSESAGPKTKKILCIGSLITVVVVIVIVVVIVTTGNKDGDPKDPTGSSTIPQEPNEPPVHPCTLCRGEEYPTLIDTGMIYDGTACADFNGSQAKLENAADDCTWGQALAWLSCGCPALPIHMEDPTCTMCSDRSTPTDLDNSSASCAEWDIFLGLVEKSDGLDCEGWRREIYARSNCSCPIDDTRIASMKTIASEYSDDKLFDEYSAQRKTLYWLAVQDPANLNVSDDTGIIIKERYVMALFYFSSTTRPTLLTDKFEFLSSKDVCSWNNGEEGVICYNNKDSVNAIGLSGNGLIGTIPVELSSLDDLVYLVLNYNDLTGSIPSEFGQLKSLQGLHLHGNKLSGSLPSALFDNQNLRWLELNFNDITGSLPLAIGYASKLELFSCYDCLLTGLIPVSIGQMTSLSYLNLEYNILTGVIPKSLSNTTKLAELYLSLNGLEGTIPTEIGLLNNLKVLDLDINMLTGTIPTEIGLLVDLTHLDLSYNTLSGIIPSEIGTCEGLTFLNLASNLCVGTVPKILGASLRDLNYLRLHGNHFTSNLTEIFCMGERSLFLEFASNCLFEVDCNCCTLCCDNKGENCKEYNE